MWGGIAQWKMKLSIGSSLRSIVKVIEGETVPYMGKYLSGRRDEGRDSTVKNTDTEWKLPFGEQQEVSRGDRIQEAGKEGICGIIELIAVCRREWTLPMRGCCAMKAGATSPYCNLTALHHQCCPSWPHEKSGDPDSSIVCLLHLCLTRRKWVTKIRGFFLEETKYSLGCQPEICNGYEFHKDLPTYEVI